MGQKTTLPNDPFKTISQKLKPFNSASDLVDLGLAGSVKTLANKRSSGLGPDYVRIKGTGIRYQRESVLSWLERDSVFIKQEAGA